MATVSSYNIIKLPALFSVTTFITSTSNMPLNKEEVNFIKKKKKKAYIETLGVIQH